jgi:hypothetical protein
MMETQAGYTSPTTTIIHAKTDAKARRRRVETLGHECLERGERSRISEPINGMLIR